MAFLRAELDLGGDTPAAGRLVTTLGCTRDPVDSVSILRPMVEQAALGFLFSPPGSAKKITSPSEVDAAYGRRISLSMSLALRPASLAPATTKSIKLVLHIYGYRGLHAAPAFLGYHAKTEGYDIHGYEIHGHRGLRYLRI